jgi:prevent-host-death family protein
MKRIAVEELANKLDVLIKVAQKESILLTRHGKPFAFVSDASDFDWEDIEYITDPDFRRMIRVRRRQRGGVSLEQMEMKLSARKRARSSGTGGAQKQAKRRSKRDGLVA